MINLSEQIEREEPNFSLDFLVCGIAGLTWVYRDKVSHVISREVMVRVSGTRLI